MTSLDYNSDPIFDLLPSFWRSHADRPILESVYEAYLRLADADYASLFTIDDNKDLSTIRPTRYQPLAYQRFDNWQASNVKHAHTSLEYAWPLPVNNRHTLRIPDVALGAINAVFANNIFIPSFVYHIKEDWWVESGQLKRGSIVVFDRNKLLKYFLEHKLDSSIYYSFSNAASSVDFGIVRILSYGYKEIITTTGDAETTTYSFGPSYDLYNSSVRLDFWDITQEVSISKTAQVSTITVPSALATGGRGYAKLSDESIVAISVLSKITLTTDALTVSKVFLYVDYNLRSKLTVTADGIKVDNTGSFPAGAEFLVRIGGKTQAVRPSTSSNQLRVSCGSNQENAMVSFLGTNVNNFRVLTETTGVNACGTPVAINQTIVFDRPLVSTASFTVTIANSDDHTHKRDVFSAPQDFAALDLGVDIEDKTTVLVFAKGRYLIPDLDYFWESDTELVFTALYGYSDKIEVLYEEPTAAPHAHRAERFVVDAGTTTEYTTKETLVDTQPTLVFADNILLQDDVAVSTSGDQIVFRDPLAARTTYSIFYTTFGRQYKHSIPPITEDTWNYRGQLVSASNLRDGITSYKIDLSSDQFEIIEEGRQRYVLTDVAMTDGWWVDAQIDDNAVQELWGELIGFLGTSTDIYARAVGAIVGAARSASSSTTIENFGSMLFGSAMVKTPGAFGGISYTSAGKQATIIPFAPTESLYTLPILACTPLNLSIQGCVDTNTPVNKLVTVVDLLNAPPKWLALLAETISDSFSSAERLDQLRTRKLTSVPYSYDRISKILTDYSIDYIAQGIAYGDLLKVNYGYVQDGYVVPPELPIVGFATVQEVLSAHRLLVDIPITLDVTGYGDNAFGSGPYGGTNELEGFILNYTMWIRERTKLDTGMLLDTLNTRTLDRLSRVLSTFGFGVEISWSGMTSEEAVAGFGRLLELTKPADTQAYVFTQAFEDLCSTPLDVKVTAAMFMYPPQIEFIPNTFSVEESFIGLESLLTTDGPYADLYTAKSLSYGPDIRSRITQEDPSAVTGEFFLVHNTVLENSRFSELYSVERGLENTLLRVSGGTYPEISYSADGIMQPQTVRGLKFVDGGYIEVATTSSTGVMTPVAQELTYTTEQEFTINVWCMLDSDQHTAGDVPVVLAWNGITLSLSYVGSGNYIPQCTTHEVTQLVSSRRVISGNTNLLTITYTQDVGGHFVTRLYVNAVLAATSSDTVGTEIPTFTEPLFIGTDVAHTVGAEFNSTIFVVDIRTVPLSAGDILELFDEKNLPPLGITTDNLPLTYDNAWVTLQTHDYWPDPVVPDYSGNAFNGTVVGDWELAYGAMTVSRPQAGDCFIVTEYEVSDLGIRQTVPRFAVQRSLTLSPGEEVLFLSNGAIAGGAAALDNNLVTLTREGATYSVPHVVYCCQTDGTWTRFVPDIAMTSSAFGIDDSTLYAGFTV